MIEVINMAARELEILKLKLDELDKTNKSAYILFVSIDGSRMERISTLKGVPPIMALGILEVEKNRIIKIVEEQTA